MLKIVSLEFNELNFDLIAEYCAKGELPTFHRLFRQYKLFQTISEPAYPNLEPWIQWPTVYSGKTFAEHGIFRLGDITDAPHDQIWELLEREGVSVGAVSPMNAANRCRNADFFIPDPWTVTKVTGEESLQRLYAIVRDTVNANAHEERSALSIGCALLPLFLRYGVPSSLPEYGRILALAARYKWARAIFLDRFLSDAFIKIRARKATDFASLFLNAGAHIQHHYMYDSIVYDGDERNPDWYSGHRAKGVDPLLCVYRTYDRVLEDLLALNDTRLLITTGLSQFPNPKIIYQYRFKEHRKSLDRLGVTGGTVVPRMSRDFLIEFPTQEEAAAAERQMGLVACAGKPLFTVENRRCSLFCQIAYFGSIEGLKGASVGPREIDLTDEVALVSIENGIHRTIGYHVDTAIAADDSTKYERIALTDIFFKMRSAFDHVPADEAARAALGA